MDSNVKSWERPWSLDEIRENSTNWNLAGDAGLLKHLEEFSKDLIKKTHVTKANFDHLFMDINNISTDLSNVTNSFLYLSNTQFVESRVYDDDDEQEQASNKVTQDTSNSKSKEELDSEKINNIREAFNYGMSILDSMYEVVEVPATSDSEDETSTSHDGAILKPKNAYIERPLPFIIGSREFMEDDNIGLQDANSDNEESPDQNFEESSIGSDLEMDVNKTQFDKLSDISAEMSNKASLTNKTNSTNDVVENMFGNTENMFNENLLNKSSSDFNKSNEGIGSENSLFGESYKDDIFGTFSNKDNLFDSTEKEKDFNFNKDPSLLSSNNNIQAESLNSEVFPSTSTKKFTNKITDNLFAENEDDDDDLFQTNINKSKELIKNNEKTKAAKTPAGGVPIFKNVDIFNKNTMKKVISIDPNDDEEDDDNDLFSQKSKEQSNSSLKFDAQSTKTNILSSAQSEDIFNEAKTSQASSSKEIPIEINEEKSNKKISSLFSDSDSENEDLLFVSKSSKKNASYKSDVSSDIFSDNHSNTFDNSTVKDTSKININNIFDDVEDDLFSNDIFNTKSNKESDMFNILAPKNLFDENFDDQSSIFQNDSPIKNENIIKPNPPKTLNLLKTTEITDIFEQSLSLNEEGKPSFKDNSENLEKESPSLKDPSKTDDIVIKVPSKPVILQSALKERARIQIKRKPSTRKARQESYKQSADSIDYFTNDHSSREFLLNKNSIDPIENNGDFKVQNTNSPLDNNDSLFQEVSKPLTSTNLSSLLSPSTDEEDIFGIPQDISTTDKDQMGIGSNIFQGAKVISPKNQVNTHSNLSSDLFDQNPLFGNNRKAEEEDDDLFSGQNSNIIKIGHSTTAKASTSLFDNDDNLFDTLKSNLKALPEKLLSNSLFDDDDNDDIFFRKKN